MNYQMAMIAIIYSDMDQFRIQMAFYLGYEATEKAITKTVFRS